MIALLALKYELKVYIAPPLKKELGTTRNYGKEEN